MKLQLSSFAAAAIVAILSSLPGCNGADDAPDDGNTGGSTPGSTSTSGTTSGGPGAGGMGAGGDTSVGSNTGGSGGGAPAIDASFATVREVFVKMACTDASCHGGEARPELYNDDTLYTRLTSYMSVACGNIPAVTPGNPERSALVKILKGPCGDVARMPNGCISEPIEEYTCVPPEYIDAIERWVASGAPQE